MPRLFWKLFGAFWLTTIVILTISIFVSFRIADERSEQSFVDPREVDVQLQAMLKGFLFQVFHVVFQNEILGSLADIPEETFG